MSVTISPAFTQFYKDAYQEWEFSVMIPNWWAQGDTFWTDNTAKRFKKLMDLIERKYWYWEVWVDDKYAFANSLQTIFDEYRDYYKELITAYETEINFLDGEKVVTSYENSSTNTPRVRYETENYDLPRTSSSINRPTTKSINGATQGTDEYEGEGETTRTGGNVIELKKKYMEMLRNLYNEFAEKFQPLFIEIFDYTMVEEED